MTPVFDWADVRYRGDADDVRELHEVYRVAQYLDTHEETLRQHEGGLREKLLSHGIHLTEQLSPRIYRIYRQACERLSLKASAEVFCMSDVEINAVAALHLHQDGAHALIGVTSAALEKLDDAELAAILGHELGHFLFEHNRLNALINQSDSSSATVLPLLGESLFLRWRKKAEISADRIGLLANNNFRSTAKALLKATFGLSDHNLNLDIEALLAQIDEIKGSAELVRASYASHPLLPIRLKALALFAQSQKAARAGFANGEQGLIVDGELEDAVDGLVQLTHRAPFKPLHQAVMQAVAFGGVKVLSADGDISEHETKILLTILHQYFTDEPEKEILVEPNEVNKVLTEALEKVNELGDHDDRVFIVSRLADIALADGALMGKEGAVVLAIAEQLGMPARSAHAALVGAAEHVGFRVDAKLNRVADELRKTLRIGLGFKDGVRP